MLLARISQKIKNLFKHIIKRFRSGALSENEAAHASSSSNTPPRRIALESGGFIEAADYVLKISGINSSRQGIGIVSSDIAALSELNSVINYACRNFRYVTLYTENKAAAERIADRVYAKYGLPIMTLGISDAEGCRYPIIADFDKGKLRCGRDVCINAAAVDTDGRVIGLYLGEKLKPI